LLTTVTAAEPDCEESAVLVACTTYVPGVFGAVYRPLLETVPPVADHVTPVGLAENCCVAPSWRVTVEGLTWIEVDVEVDADFGAAVTPAQPVPTTDMHNTAMSPKTAIRCLDRRLSILNIESDSAHPARDGEQL